MYTLADVRADMQWVEYNGGRFGLLPDEGKYPCELPGGQVVYLMTQASCRAAIDARTAWLAQGN